MPHLPSWLSDPGAWLGGMAIASALMLVVAALLLPWILGRIPPDYFLETPSEHRRHSRHPGARAAMAVARNLLGLVLVLAGVAMLVLPGQGLLTILAGLVLVDVPGKRRVELALLRRRSVKRAVDWLRRRTGHPPLQLPATGAASGRDGSP